MSKKHHIKSSRRGVIRDPINPGMFNSMNIMFCCEQCTHFDATNEYCTIGYDATKHLRRVQMHQYELSGRMAVCRFQEVD